MHIGFSKLNSHCSCAIQLHILGLCRIYTSYATKPIRIYSQSNRLSAHLIYYNAVVTTSVAGKSLAHLVKEAFTPNVYRAILAIYPSVYRSFKPPQTYSRFNVLYISNRDNDISYQLLSDTKAFQGANLEAIQPLSESPMITAS